MTFMERGDISGTCININLDAEMRIFSVPLPSRWIRQSQMERSEPVYFKSSIFIAEPDGFHKVSVLRARLFAEITADLLTSKET